MTCIPKILKIISILDTLPPNGSPFITLTMVIHVKTSGITQKCYLKSTKGYEEASIKRNHSAYGASAAFI